MTSRSRSDYLASLLRELCKLPRETEWVEFKVNNAEPQEIGEYISALANSAALVGQGLCVPGLGRCATATTRSSAPASIARAARWATRSWRAGCCDCWSRRSISGSSTVSGRRSVRGAPGDRARLPPSGALLGTRVHPGRDLQEEAQGLSREGAGALAHLRPAPFEDGIAAERATGDEVLRLLDYPAYFDLLERPLPPTATAFSEALASDRLIRACSAGGWDITNLWAHSVRQDVSTISPRCGARRCGSSSTAATARTGDAQGAGGPKGYAYGFDGLIGFINGLLPANEVIEQALRKSVPMFPELAVRELVANALIHQDLFVPVPGRWWRSSTTVSRSRIPGEPLVDTQRFVDTPSQSHATRRSPR